MTKPVQHARCFPHTQLAVLLGACIALGGCGLVTRASRAVPEAGRITTASAEQDNAQQGGGKRGGAKQGDAEQDDVKRNAVRVVRDRDEARELTTLAPREPYWPFRLSQLLAEADSLAAAEAALKVSLERDTSYAPALALLSKLYFESRRHAEAVSLLEAARARGGMPDELLAGLALHYDALDQPDRARAILSALSESRTTRPARVFVALRGNSPDDAVRDASAAVGDDPKNAVYQNNYGITKLRSGDVPAARRAFLAAIDLNPGLPGPYYNLAILEKYYVFDDPAAKRWFEAYWKRSHDDPDSLQRVLGQGESDELAKRGGAQ